MSGFVDQIRTYIEALEPGQRRVIGAVVVFATLLLVGVGVWSWSDRYVTAYSSRSTLDVQEVSAALEAQGVPHKVTSDGLSVQVLPEHEGQARIASASAGKVMGFEVLDALELGTSPRVEQWAYQRALQGELTTTINSLEEVEYSRVHLVLPERSAFLRDERPPTASVTLKLLPGAKLTKAQLRGITSLVAGAVNGLKANDVVLIDHAGELLSGGDEEEGPLASMPTLLALRDAEARRVTRSIEDSLARVLGSLNDVTVGVSVEVETRSLDRLTRSQDPDTQVLISEVIREEASQSTEPGGIPGTEANLPEEQPNTANSTNRETLEQRSNYDYTKVEERETRQPGDIKRVTVGVVVNSERIEALAKAIVGVDENGEQDAEAVAAKVSELQGQVQDTVKVAMGFDETRNDDVVVTFLPFSANAPDEPEVAQASFGDLVQSYGPLSLVLIAILLFFFMVIRPLVSSVARAVSPPEPLALETTAPGTSSLLGEAGSAEGEQREASRNLTERLRAMVDNFENVDAADLNRLVDLEQEATAQVLRRWIRES